MRIHFDNVVFGGQSGPNCFATRLAKAFFESGHEVVNNGPDANVSLVLIEPTGLPLAKKKIQRIDGIWFKPEEFYQKNQNIKRFYDIADAVIWQSKFDRRFVTKLWGDHRCDTIISNGIANNVCKKITSPALEQIRNQYKLVFCCSSNWHRQKRLKENIELFKHIQSTIENSSALIVLGSNPEIIADKDIFFAGQQSHDVCDEVYSISNWMLHLAWLDHSPNIVCEALNQGTPVICSEDGGTSELVGDFGVVLKEKEKFKFTLTDYDNPPIFDVSQLKSLPTKNLLGNHKEINIEIIAKQYIGLFERILDE